MPLTTGRSSSTRASSSSGDLHMLDDDPSYELASPQHDDSDGQLEAHMSAAQQGVKALRRRISSLKRQNVELRTELDELHNSVEADIQPRRGRTGGMTNADLQRQVRSLKADIHRLKKLRAKDKGKIQKASAMSIFRLQLKEVEADMAELQNELANGVPDTTHVMRKLLRRFQDIISSVALAEEEEDCTICLEHMELNRCSSLLCQHIFCDDCLTRLQSGSPEVTCPQCREPCKREDFETVQFTADQQWDYLTEIAKEFAEMDTRGEQETSEEEAEEAFVDDGDPDASSTASEVAHQDSIASEPDPDPPTTTTPPPDQTAGSSHDLGVTYSNSPRSLKKRRLEQLIATRSQKKSVPGLDATVTCDEGDASTNRGKQPIGVVHVGLTISYLSSIPLTNYITFSRWRVFVLDIRLATGSRGSLMALNISPRKIVPLASGDDWEPPVRSKTAGTTTKRVFFCGVVVESENGQGVSEEVQDLVASLGEPLHAFESGDSLPTESLNDELSGTNGPRRRALTDSSAIQDIVNELVSTERSYVKRLHILKFDYADPLRTFARNKDTAILPAYEAKTLFGNVDNLLPVNESFLADLEKMVLPDGPQTVGYIGDVALRHFKELRGFDQYKQYYVKREEAQAIFEREMSKRSSGFAAYVDRIKYSSTDTKNRVGLRELLMDPVQRIPRYTLMFRTMIKRMHLGDPQRVKLLEADDIASRIALAETDEQTKRAAVMYCLGTTMDGFPPALVSNSRRFIDCVDVEDISLDTPLPSSASGAASSPDSLHCSLFLFDDKLMIVKRPGNGEKSGRSLSGLDLLEKVMKASGRPVGIKRSGISCKGVVDISEVVATDVGDFHLYLENPPQDQTDRWSGRSFRSLSVVLPPAPVNMNPTKTEIEKMRFLENLWQAQAVYRTKSGQSVALRGEEREVEAKKGRVTIARTYFNIYQRTDFLKETKKTKVVVQIDALGSSDPLPFGMNGPPHVAIRVQPMAGELCRYTVTSGFPNDEPSDEDIVQAKRIPERIVDTIHSYGLFKFRTGRNSLPSTPTASTRSRAAIFGLDVISRNLFNARASTSKAETFGNSVSSHRRTKSTISRSSVYTHTTSDGSLMRFSHRSGSTAATSVYGMDDESIAPSRASTPSRNLLKRRMVCDQVAGLNLQPGDRTPPHSDEESEGEPPGKIGGTLAESDPDLSLRLLLAKQNSQSQEGHSATASWDSNPIEETIYEEEPPPPIRPPSRASTPATRPVTPFDGVDTAGYRPRSISQVSYENRPAAP
ncbi:hypothetical protein EW146_g8604, partial [Bondarzewia mesenterica]